MLEELSIRGLGVIDEASVQLSGGLTVLTGETGAGKTMVLTALGLLIGEKADTGKVRDGNERTSVEAVFSHLRDDVVDRIDDAGGETENGTVVVARVVTAQRSRALLGGRTVPASVLADVGRRMIAVHGQDDQVHLRRPSAQRDALDRFAGAKHVEALAQYRSVWDDLRALRAQWQAVTADATRAAERLAWITRGLAAVDALLPEPGEDEQLRAFIDRAQNAEDFRVAATTALAALNGFEQSASTDAPDAASVTTLLAVALKALTAASVSDPALAALSEELEGLVSSTDAISHELCTYLEELSGDPTALERSLDRRGALRDARRSWCDADAAASVELSTVTDHADALIAWRDAARAEAAEGDPSEQAERLRLRLDEAEQQRDELSRSIRRTRRSAAQKLSKAVSAEIAALGMAGATMDVLVEPHEPDAHGADRVSFALRARPDAPPVPIERGASGGEMSRIMLGLEVVLAASDPVGTFVFDEVDAGVGGRAATEVGARLAQLARTAQVIVVTHLPQVAAFADTHIVVEKASDGGVTASGVHELDDAARARELARMLSGMEDSQLGQAHADELLAAAHARRASGA